MGQIVKRKKKFVNFQSAATEEFSPNTGLYNFFIDIYRLSSLPATLNIKSDHFYFSLKMVKLKNNTDSDTG